MSISATFNGVKLSSADFSISQGTRPGSGSIVFPTDSVIVDKTGFLQISDGITSIAFGPLYTTIPTRTSNTSSGKGTTVTVEDRRYTWKWGYIHGEYNLLYDGIKDEEQNLAGLIDFCMFALDETNYALISIPNVFPEVRWKFDKPADVLQDLCDQFGLRIGYDTDNAIVIAPINYITTVTAGDESSISTSIQNDILPRKLILHGDRKVVQRTFPALIPVGEDSNGDIVPVNDLSYKPATSWEEEIVKMFTGVTDENDRDLAAKTIFKWYAIDWSTVTQNKRYILPFINHIVDTVDKNGLVDFDKPYINGEKTIWDGVEFKKQTKARLSEGYSFDRKLGIIKFTKPVYKATSDGTSTTTFDFPDLDLVCAYLQNEGTIDDYIWWEQNISNGTEIETSIEDSSLVGYYHFNESTGQPYADPTNALDIDPYALDLLDAAAQEFVPATPGERTYVGVQNIGAVGLTRTVSFNCSYGGGVETNAQWGIEIPSLYMPGYEERLRLSKVDNKLVRGKLGSAFAGGSGSGAVNNSQDSNPRLPDEADKSDPENWDTVSDKGLATNSTGVDIAAKSVVHVDNYNSSTRKWEVTKPTTGNQTRIAFTRYGIKNGTFGRIYFTGPNVVTKSGTVAVGDIVGTTATVSHNMEKSPGGTHKVVKVDGNDLTIVPLSAGGSTSVQLALTQAAAGALAYISCKLCDINGTVITGTPAFNAYAVFTDSATVVNTCLPRVGNGEIVMVQKIEGTWLMVNPTFIDSSVCV